MNEAESSVSALFVESVESDNLLGLVFDFFRTSNFCRIRAEKISSPPKAARTNSSLVNFLPISFIACLLALFAPPTKPLPDSISEMYLLAKLIYFFFAFFGVQFFLFLLANNLSIMSHKCFFPKVSYFPIQLNYICDVALKQNLSHNSFSMYHNERLDEKTLHTLYSNVFFI